jgi:fumarate hydratase subunit beta
MKKLKIPATEEEILSLRAGDAVEIYGTVYTARDAAHKRLCALISEGKELPFDAKGAAVYYVGPTPAKPGRVIGSAGPTSSYRMDSYTEPLLCEGLKVMIGKGPRSDELRAMLKKHRAVYLSAIGGAAASISESIKDASLVAYEDLGAEAIYRLDAEGLYAVVTYDAHGGDLFREGREKYLKT